MLALEASNVAAAKALAQFKEMDIRPTQAEIDAFTDRFLLEIVADPKFDIGLKLKASAQLRDNYISQSALGSDAKLIEALAPADKARLDALVHRYHDLDEDDELRGFTDEPPLTPAEKAERAAERAAIEQVVPETFLHPVEPPDPLLKEMCGEVMRALADDDGTSAPVVYEPHAEVRQRLEAELEPPIEVLGNEPVGEDAEPQQADRQRAAPWPEHYPRGFGPLPRDDVDDAAAPGDDGADD